MKHLRSTGRLALFLTAVLFLFAVPACAGSADPAMEDPTQPTGATARRQRIWARTAAS